MPIGLALLLGIALLSAWHGLGAVRAALRVKSLETELRHLEHARAIEQAPSVGELRQRLVAWGPPLQPAEAELRARLWWLVARRANSPADQIAALREARDLLRGALARKPGWPYTWLLLAQVQYALDPKGRDAAVALGAALDIGIRGFLLQKQMLETWQQADAYLDASLRERLLQALRIGIRDHGYDLARELRHSDHLDWVCGDPENHARVREWCRDQGWPEPH